jgi:hypothetical protein
MKKIINGKKYDTETAKLVGEWTNGYYANDFHYCSEDLYLKKTGEFFIYGSGGAMSKYAEAAGNNNWYGGEQIIPVTYEAAQKWAEENLSENEYEVIFGEIDEDETRIITSISLSRTTYNMLKRISQEQGGEPIGSVIDRLMQNI